MGMRGGSEGVEDGVGVKGKGGHGKWGGGDTHVHRKYFSCSCNHVPSSPLRLTRTYTLYNCYTLIYSALHNLAKVISTC